MGNCGVTFAPIRPGQERYLAGMMDSVEDIPTDTIMAGLDWGWETYGDRRPGLWAWVIDEVTAAS